MKLVFDFDGTLLDSFTRHRAVLADCLEKEGILFPLDDYLTFKADGHSTRDYLLAKGVDRSQAERAAAEWIRHIEEWRHLSTDRLYPDSLEVLEMCRKHGHILYLLSARSREDLLLKQTGMLGIDSYFQSMVCVPPREASRQKAKALISIKADMMVGDTEADWTAAQSACTQAYILNRGGRSKVYWDKKGVRSFCDLQCLLEKI